VGDLITAGNEMGDGADEENACNAKKALDLIQWYNPDYESDEDDEFTSFKKSDCCSAFGYYCTIERISMAYDFE
jgi:hypothetical protein